MRSFSNPNYGLDALNSNCVLSSDEHTSNDDVIVDNMTSLNGDRRYATDNGLPFEQATFSLFAVSFFSAGFKSEKLESDKLLQIQKIFC